MRVVLLALALFAAGCVGASEEADPAETELTSVAATWPEPEVFTWSGHVLASDLEGPTHIQPTEQLLFPVFQEGFLFSFDELPAQAEVALDWTGDGEFMIMLHSHKEHGTNTYAEHITEMSAEKPKCLRIPTEDLVTGEWQVMIHSNDARQADFTITVSLWGGAGHIVEDKYHGHWLQDGSFEIEEREILPCGTA